MIILNDGKRKRSTQQLDFDLNAIDRCRLHVYRLWGLVPYLNIFYIVAGSGFARRMGEND